MASPLPPLPPFNVHEEPDSSGSRWRRWLHRFETYAIAYNITSETRKKALLLLFAGEDVQTIHDALSSSPSFVRTEHPYADAVSILNSYFQPKQNTHFEVFKFRETKQLDSENIASYHVRLQRLAADCEFSNTDNEIMDHIIRTCKSSTIREKALQTPDLTLQKLLDMARLIENTDTQAQLMSAALQNTNNEAINRISKGKLSEKPQKNENRSSSNYSRNNYRPETQQERTCRNCGYAYPHPMGRQCPASGKQCRTCGKFNHFSKVCRSRNRISCNQHTVERGATVHAMETVDGVDELQNPFNDSGQVVFTISPNVSENLPRVILSFGPDKINFLADTGSSCNLLNTEVFNSLKVRPTLTPTSARLFPYGSNKPIPIAGKFDYDVTYGHETYTDVFYVTVTDVISTPILGYPLLRKIGFFKTISNVQIEPTDLVKKYADVFEGMGRLKDTQVKLHIKPDVTPIAQPHRRIPFQIRQKVDDEIASLLAEDIIEPVRGPTPWVSPVVIAPKPGNKEKIRLCVDMRMANTAIERERHPTPTVDDLIHELNGATVFTKLDLRKAYHQIEIAEESRFITTFSVHSGLFRFKRLTFGVNSAAEIFQNQLEKGLQGLQGARNVSDDILVYGRNDKEHDTNLEKTLQRLRELGLKLEKSKCEFKKRSLKFYGLIFDEKGIRLDPDKIQAVTEMSIPKSVQEVQSFLGMVTYCARFISHFSDISAPLRELIKKGKPWIWTSKQQNSFETLKQCLLENTNLAYFDSTKETILTVDASSTGLGAVLAQQSIDKQDFRVIAYASKSLTAVEQRYSAIEKETLAVKWACQKFRLYLYGSHFTVYTDHKPLLALLNNPRSKTSVRIERWILDLQAFDFHIVFIKGSSNGADYLSRHSVTSDDNDSETDAFVHFIRTTRTPIALQTSDIEIATQNDQTLQLVLQRLVTGHWEKNSFPPDIDVFVYKRLFQMRHELSESQNILFRGDRIVIPKSLQQTVVNIAHEAHLGIVKTKMLLREKVWFPGLDNLVERTIRNCLACQAATPDTRPEQFHMSTLPDAPWQELSADFFGPLPTGEYLLVIIDDYSRFPIVEIVQSTSATSTIDKLENNFATFGIPAVIRTDNGPPFQSNEFAKFSHEMGFKHHRITPYWPAANGIVERFMRSLKKTMQTAIVEQVSWKKALYTFLRNYRETPQLSTKKSPAELILRMTFRTKLPSIHKSPDDHQDVKRNDERSKTRMQEGSLQRVRKTPRDIRTGDSVLLAQKKHTKTQSFYDPIPYEVVETDGTRVTALRGSSKVRRNISHFKNVTRARSANNPTEEQVSSTLASTDETTPVIRSSCSYNLRPRIHRPDYYK